MVGVRALRSGVLAVLASACVLGAPPRPRPLAPLMEARRADAVCVARALEKRVSAEGRPAARRLLRVGVEIAGIEDAELLALDRSMRREAARLVEALEADDLTAAGRAFERMLRRCAACHDRMGGPPSLLEDARGSD